jgi:hypothetical protein
MMGGSVNCRIAGLQDCSIDLAHADHTPRARHCPINPAISSSANPSINSSPNPAILQSGNPAIQSSL